jgi:DNA-binding NtrC family response regulator
MTPFIFGTSEKMRELERKVRSVALSGLPVLIEGEGGAGKEALARHLHALSGRTGEFFRVFCAQARQLGALRFNASGTTFLKHVRLLPPRSQEQVLAALERGASSDRDPVIGLVSSACKPLEELAVRGEFLPDLYYRLSAYKIYVPPLRERIQDLPELFADMVARFTVNGESAPTLRTHGLMEALMSYDWPGNLRELQNIARACVLSQFPGEIAADLRSHARQPDTERPASLKEQVRSTSRKVEAEIILKALERHRWNRRRAAESLKISYRSLLYKMKSCEIRATAQMQPEGGE